MVKRLEKGYWGSTGLRPIKVCFVSPNFLQRGCKILGNLNVEWQSNPCGRQNHLELWHPWSQINFPRVHSRCSMRDRDRKFLSSDGFRLQIVPEHALQKFREPVGWVADRVKVKEQPEERDGVVCQADSVWSRVMNHPGNEDVNELRGKPVCKLFSCGKFGR